MATTNLRYNPNYFIQHSALSMRLNGNSYVAGDSTYSEYVAVSCVSGTKIALNNSIALRGSNEIINIGYAASLTYRTWTLAGYNTKFDETYITKKMYVYARLDASESGSSGLVIFSPNNYDYDGGIITEVTDADELAKYAAAASSDRGTYITLGNNSSSEESLAAKASIIAEFPKSNADLTSTKRIVSASAVTDKGWTGVTGTYCTYFSHNTGLEDIDSTVYQFLWTPITDNGIIQTPDACSAYLTDLENRAKTDSRSILQLDKDGLNLIIGKYTTVEESNTKAARLHELAAIYYGDLSSAVSLNDVYHTNPSTNKVYKRTPPTSATYYYMQLGVINAPVNNIRDWDMNISGWEGLDLGQLDTPLSTDDDKMFEWYNDMIHPLAPFSDLDLEGNLIWRGTTIYGPFTKDKSIETALNGDREYIPTLSAVSENFIAKFKDDNNQDHKLSLGQLVVDGHQVEKEAVYYNPDTEYATINGITYIKSTLGGPYTSDQLTVIDGKSYLTSSLQAVSSGGSTTYIIGDNAVEANEGDRYVIKGETRSFTSADIVNIGTVAEPLYYISSTLFEGRVTPASIKVENGEAGTYTFKSIPAPNDGVKCTAVTNSVTGSDTGLKTLALFDHLTKDLSGAGVWRDENDFLHIETDYLSVHNKLTAKEIEVEEVNYIGGCLVLTPADGFTTDIVEPLDEDGNITSSNPTFYRLCWRSVDSSGRTVKNMWKVGDQALSQTFNLGTGDNTTSLIPNDVYTDVSTGYWWRVVTSVGTDYKPMPPRPVAESDTNDKETADDTYNYIIVSNDSRSSNAPADFMGASKFEDYLSLYRYVAGSSIPTVGEAVVMLGHQPQADENDTDVSNRQGAIFISAASSRPYICEYTGIKNLSFASATLGTRIQPGNNLFSGTVVMSSDSTIPNDLLPEGLKGIDDKIKDIETTINGLKFNRNNLIRNSAFRGDWLSASIRDNTQFTPGKETFSESFLHWSRNNENDVFAEEDDTSETGSHVQMINGTITQSLYYKCIVGIDYNFSFRAKVTAGSTSDVTIKIADQSHTFTVTNSEFGDTLSWSFQLGSLGNTLEISNTGTVQICELQLEKGNIATGWGLCILDNTDDVAFYSSLQYLAEATQEDTIVEGGLILTSLIQLGQTNADGTWKPNAGINGIINYVGQDISPYHTPAFWAGGELENAEQALLWYGGDISKAPPTEAEKANLPNPHATAVIAHDGTAIFNNAILTGSVYADNGSFRGKVEATEGSFHGKIEAVDGYLENMTLSSSLLFDGKVDYQLTPVTTDGQSSLALQYFNNNTSYTAVDFGFYIERGGASHPFLQVGDDGHDSAHTLITHNTIDITSNSDGATHIGTKHLQINSPDSLDSYISISFYQPEGISLYLPQLLLRVDANNYMRAYIGYDTNTNKYYLSIEGKQNGDDKHAEWDRGLGHA